MPEWRRAGIRSLLEPATIAIIGVSSRLNPGRIILRNILDSGFPASGVRVVKQDRAEIDGCACVPGIDALDPPADLLVQFVAAAQAADVPERAARGSHARSIILRSATDKAWIAVVDSGPAYDPMARALGDAGIPVFRRADRALAMFGRYAAWRRQRAREAQPGRP